MTRVLPIRYSILLLCSFLALFFIIIIYSEQGVPLAANQIQYSLLSRKVGEEVKEVCDELGICMIAYSPLGLGILGGKYKVCVYIRCVFTITTALT